MILYNDYINKWLVKNSYYESKICFVKTLDENIFYTKSGAHIHFKNEKFNGYYELTDDIFDDQIYVSPYTFNLGKFLTKNNDILINLKIISIRFAYIKIIDDKINPKLNEQYFIFKVDNKLYNEMVLKLHLINKCNFKLIIERKNHMYNTGYSYENYDKSFFIYDEKNEIKYSIMLKDIIKLKNINFNLFRRKLKLDNLNML